MSLSPTDGSQISLICRYDSHETRTQSCFALRSRPSPIFRARSIVWLLSYERSANVGSCCCHTKIYGKTALKYEDTVAYNCVTAKRKTSRQKEKPHSKKKNLTAKRKASRQKEKQVRTVYMYLVLSFTVNSLLKDTSIRRTPGDGPCRFSVILL